MVDGQEEKPYRVLMKRSAERELRQLQSPDLDRVSRAIDGLATNPRPRSSQKLAGMEVHRLRQGDYRIVYLVDDKRRIVEVVKIGHRREVYR